MEGLGGGARHFSGADDHDVGVFEVAEDFFGEVDGDGADGGLAFLDGGGVADFFADGESALEEFVEGAAGGLGFEGGGVSFFDLAEDFGFAEDHGVEAGDDAAEVGGGFAGLFFVEVFVDGEAEAFVEMVGKGRGSRGEVFGGEVELGAIAGGKDEAFLNDFATVEEGLGFFAEVRGCNGDLLPDFDGSGFVIEAEAEEFHRGVICYPLIVIWISLEFAGEGDESEEKEGDGGEGESARRDAAEVGEEDEGGVTEPDDGGGDEVGVDGKAGSQEAGEDAEGEDDKPDEEETFGGIDEVGDGREVLEK